jgi:hypothetical protein
VRDYVRDKKCCDDLALNGVVASSSRKGPVWVKVPSAVPISSSSSSPSSTTQQEKAQEQIEKDSQYESKPTISSFYLLELLLKQFTYRWLVVSYNE